MELSQTANFFALTTDLWTSRANHTYTGLTIHFLSPSFEMHHFLLDTKEFPESHTAENIGSELQVILKDWKLSEDGVTSITTDNGAKLP